MEAEVTAGPRGPLRPLSVAPMVDRTDRELRSLLRGVTRRVLLYTEMISLSAALGPRSERALGFDPIERPLALQLGGDDPTRLAEAARLATALGYDEIDLNCGCPSSRVRSGCFGVVLMKDPDRVAQCVAAMREATPLPVTVKHRLGVDELDRYEDVVDFVQRVAHAGADRFIVHARKAWLQGLSPHENRTVPPLRHEWVHQLQREHPQLRFEINGGITTLDEAFAHLDAGIGGVMIGRAVYDDPMMLATADARLAAREQGRAWEPPPPVDAAARVAMLRSLLPGVQVRVDAGVRLSAITRHLMGFVHGLPGARRFRQRLSVASQARPGDASLLVLAIDELAEAITTAAA